MDGGKYGMRKEKINLEQRYRKWRQTLRIWKGVERDGEEDKRGAKGNKK